MSETLSGRLAERREPQTYHPAQAARRSGSPLQRQARRFGLLFTLPVIVVLLLLVVLPLLQALWYSFTNWDGSSATWIALQNYESFFKNPAIGRIFVNSFFILLSLPFGMIFPFVTAYLLSSNFRGSRLFRTLIFAPTVLSWVVIGLVARSAFEATGPINTVLSAIGLRFLAVNWLANGTAALVAVILTFNAAVYGINTIILLTGLSTIDIATIEAARIDGASGFRILLHIVLPAMRRFVEFVFIITMVTSLSGLFGLIYVMTSGGPGSDTTTLDFAVWQQAFSTGQFGQGAAMGIVLMLLILVVIGAVRLFSRTGDRD